MTYPRSKKNIVSDKIADKSIILTTNTTNTVTTIINQIKAKLKSGYRPKHTSISRLLTITGLAKSTYYYNQSSLHQNRIKIQEENDKEDLELIRSILKDHPHYGHRRIADHCRVFLGISINWKRIQRIKHKYGLQTRYRRPKKELRDVKLVDAITLGIVNQVRDITPEHPNHIWSTDFTYLYFQGVWYYLSTIKDNYTKEILAWTFSDTHNVGMVISTLQKALNVFGTPIFHHSDQGSEYRAEAYRRILTYNGVIISMSDKGKPTQNGFQESYYSYFKLELGNISRFNTLQELKQGIAKQIYYYNYFRIHSVIRTTPSLFRRSYNSHHIVENMPLNHLEKMSN